MNLDAWTLNHLSKYAGREFGSRDSRLEELFVEYVVDTLADMHPDDGEYAINRDGGWNNFRNDFYDSIADSAVRRLEA